MPPAAKKQAAAKVKRIKLTLPTESSKATTSEGVYLHGAVIDLPAEEADEFINDGRAHLSDQELEGEEQKLPHVPQHMRIPG